jgi:hypothetical protein
MTLPWERKLTKTLTTEGPGMDNVLMAIEDMWGATRTNEAREWYERPRKVFENSFLLEWQNKKKGNM